ncbi:CRISPR-associated protein Cas2 [Thermobaculum terrenum ATCC BAA-798]|uniref:CRISPR-associated protein Cas2 n=1 Tax=Thermobaculum terrenum (strain ATCC BAA-798 / CCMEE 7001 / YNP1) TaxID=525904 RepID=D1CGD7_THET1|nr:type I-E CRISPR-associated endoribonuclease Cas2e [Thermobaculum terrenum]ACZ42808.1 CRISPR-associated protein Cas2 [Thermobaculum terrenum ATCC BAA-798]
MTVIVVEKVPASVRGELTRWLLEPRTGVFVGRPSALVRDKLWELVCQRIVERTGPEEMGGAVMIYTSDNEQGFEMRIFGDTSRDLVDFEGLWLVKV